ncbi:NADPH:quinone reductase [Candidatus Falkowbacteria bacterium RIFOXYB2_FULL_34_18]|uniref:NADPH:quinone reductase n=1 Tax=Candidatus Falkowbacteria bacterium RIFOXYD2_FULL_34_120 TaxID=1798007 RepID=A0A1F5TPK3_9BACT|nr:MAG: NADPH:quinone reductase [Candidatus Falkowbacteria bacterium RIFOXYB2_FULL_34_18]OGF29252.1 MAG: NADPH:quinone reductase [Candidatus Falkowbacteria bacterium RIFOXYC12_FULL_34_55]OGF36368.1 MAG: NADPH:quinone reductase [Candidatus Falkowbacteria bacterium RIFOXYC2_FULL_34_220]OGF38847.1 MAG: NADPH:quinone reductase [Candidatus Falkowbacteria bacterium RIFOXYD12_FULL_34_57]OGF40866.1 MAG: NADPH:quinone reductase [Candidatus Falkowbacteria bacterium RIFOXYD2_FULL_34_120]
MKILIILGHPDKQGLCSQLFESYIKGAENGGHEVRAVQIRDLDFDPILHRGYRAIQELEPDLKKVQADILWAQHLVFVFPIWWASAPALLKGFFDRIMLPGFAFRFRKNSSLWDKLLKGRSARLIVAMGGFNWYYNLFMCRSGVKTVRDGILKFCGVSPVRVTQIDRSEKLLDKKEKYWIEKIRQMGQMGQ